jgi:flagellar hook-associated protein 3 FlgL
MNDTDGVEDIDLAETIVELKTQAVVYEGALSTTARVIQTTLREFLR